MSHIRAVDNLVVILDNLVKAYRLLLDLVRTERELLVEARLDELQKLNADKEIMLAKISQIEDQRVRTLRELNYTYKLEGETPRLLDLARVVSGETGARLRSSHSTLEIVLKRVQEINSGNAELAQNALRVAKGAIEDIRSSMAPHQKTYERQGKIQNAPTAQPSFVSREV